MADAIIRVYDNTTRVIVHGSELLAPLVASAAAHRAAAEVARDVAQIAALTAPMVYEDTAAGLAAVAEGESFWVEAAEGPQLYREVGGVAVAIGSPLSASAAATAAMAAAASAAAAEADADDALTARLLAESARDAVLAATVYPDTATGLAAVAEGEYFFVAGAGSTLMSLYRDVAGVATLIGTYPSGSSVAGILGGASVSDQTLKDWVSAESFEITAATISATTFLPTTATVKWPDGSTGTFTPTSVNAAFTTIDAFTISHAASGKTVTQAAVTRNSNGQITAKPALTVA